jgi:8-oxo-dGTP diphosphatase
MVKRKVPQGTLGWQFPGALVDSHDGLKRRVVDETFQETRIICDFHRILGERIHLDTKKYVVYSALRYVSGDPHNGQPKENAEVRWVDIRDAPMLLSSDLSADVSEYLSLFQHE